MLSKSWIRFGGGALSVLFLWVSPPAYAQEVSARNVILMISDGIGFNGWLATDYYQGLAGQQAYQVTRPDGTEPVIMAASHYALNMVDASGTLLPPAAEHANMAGAVEQGYDPRTRWLRFENQMLNDFSPVLEPYTSYTDSAAAGTALMSGRKTSGGRVNVSWTGTQHFRTIAEIAMDHERSAGVVTSVLVSHATPAAAIAHNLWRDNYDQIFNEMVGSDLSVIMGAGHPLYDDSGNRVEPSDEAAYAYLGGLETFQALTSPEGLNDFKFIEARSEFEALANGQDVPERVVGIARAHETLQAVRSGLLEAGTPSGMAYNPIVPDLATMSQAALNVLSQGEDGMFLMIEGGAIDWMAHVNDMPRHIEEQIDFNRAVAAVIDWVEENSSWEETLLIVTSDHETGGVWGDGTWTNGVGGPVATDRSAEAILAAQFDPTEDVFNGYFAVQNRGTGNLPGFMWASGNHTNELVPLWAIGTGSEHFEEFTRTDLEAAKLWGEPYGWRGDFVDNTTVFHVMNRVIAAGGSMLGDQ